MNQNPGSTGSGGQASPSNNISGGRPLYARGAQACPPSSGSVNPSVPPQGTDNVREGQFVRILYPHL